MLELYRTPLNVRGHKNRYVARASAFYQRSFPSIGFRKNETFNHGVQGSNPCALTRKHRGFKAPTPSLQTLVVAH